MNWNPLTVAVAAMAALALSAGAVAAADQMYSPQEETIPNGNSANASEHKETISAEELEKTKLDSDNITLNSDESDNRLTTVDVEKTKLDSDNITLSEEEPDQEISDVELSYRPNFAHNEQARQNPENASEDEAATKITVDESFQTNFSGDIIESQDEGIYRVELTDGE